MASLLETVNKVITDNGIAGGEEITSFDDLQPEISRIIGFVVDADLEIQRSWHDWQWMYFTALAGATAGTDVIDLPTITVQSVTAGVLGTTTLTDAYPIKDIDRDSMLCRPGTSGPFPITGGASDATPIPFMEWDQFERVWERGEKTAQDVPSAWSWRPNKTLVLSHLAPTGGLELRYRYWIMPRKVPRHIDAYIHVPSCVVDVADTYYAGVSQAVVELATMKWARAERQFDMMTVAAESYRIAMEDLRSMYGKQQNHHQRMSAEMPLAVGVQ